MTPAEIQATAARIKARTDAQELLKLAELSAADHHDDNAQRFWDTIAQAAAIKAGWGMSLLELTKAPRRFDDSVALRPREPLAENQEGAKDWTQVTVGCAGSIQEYSDGGGVRVRFDDPTMTVQKSIWLPGSAVSFDHGGQSNYRFIAVSMPLWLAEEKELPPDSYKE